MRHGKSKSFSVAGASLWQGHIIYEFTIQLHSFSLSSCSIRKWKVMETEQPGGKATSSFLRPMEATHIVVGRRNKEDPQRHMLILAQSLES